MEIGSIGDTAQAYLTIPIVKDTSKEILKQSLILANSNVSEMNRIYAEYALYKLARSDISAEMKSRIVDPATKALEDKSTKVRNNAAKIISWLVMSEISSEIKSAMVDPLIKTLENVNEYTDTRSVLAINLCNLAQQDIPSAIKSIIADALIELLENKNIDEKALGVTKDYLTEYKDTDIPPELRSRIEKALKDYKNTDISPELEK